VHGDADDLKSQPAGNAGPRIALGVIGLAEVKAPAGATKK
jgi:Cu-Zn family superoxide dismutase